MLQMAGHHICNIFLPKTSPRSRKRAKEIPKPQDMIQKSKARPPQFSIGGPPAAPSFQWGALPAIVLHAKNCTSYKMFQNWFCCVNQFFDQAGILRPVPSSVCKTTAGAASH